MPKRSLVMYDRSSSEEEGAYQSKADIPDRSKSDYYCPMCDSRMNSEQMWKSHIIGKRHLKNSKKRPGEMPSKQKFVPSSAISRISHDLDQVTDEPIVGLDYICETRRSDPTVDPLYTCYLCQSTNPMSTIIDHIVSTKHRINYVRKEDPNTLNVVEQFRLSKGQNDQIIRGHASDCEEKFGRGRIEVKMEKTNSQIPYSIPSRGHKMKSESRKRVSSPPIDPSMPSTSFQVAPSTSSMTPKPSTSKPEVPALPAGPVWDLERDAKDLTTDQVMALLETVYEDYEKNPESYEEPDKLKILAHYVRINLNSMLIAKYYSLDDPDDKEKFKDMILHPTWEDELRQALKD